MQLSNVPSLENKELYGTIIKHQDTHLDGLFIVSGDFNQARFSSALPKLHHYVELPLEGNNMLD